MAPSDQPNDLEQEILNEAPRLAATSRFRFSCHPGISCFNVCCRDVNIVLSPYDVLRLRRRLGLGSQEFLAEFTILPFGEKQRLPIPLLKMGSDEQKRCPFVGEQGCTVYEDRPWPCRAYPIGEASSGSPSRPGEQFYFLVAEEHCHGHAETNEWTVGTWLENQGVAPYQAFGELLKEVTLHPRLAQGMELGPKQMEMYFMATYELDRFRRFIFESRFLECYEVAQAYADRLREDDEELLRFGLNWLRFVLFGEPTMRIKPEVLEAKRAAMASRP